MRRNFAHRNTEHMITNMHVYTPVCVCDCVCVCVCVTVVLPGLPGSGGAGRAGRWIVLLGCGVAVSLLLLRMDVGGGGQAYHVVTSQTTGCHAPRSMTRPPPRAFRTASLCLIPPAWTSDKFLQMEEFYSAERKMAVLCHHHQHQHQGLADDPFNSLFVCFVLSLYFFYCTFVPNVLDKKISDSFHSSQVVFSL